MTVTFDKDFANKVMTVTSTFAASKKFIWDAFTKSEMMEKWWAPKPYVAVIKEMNFSNNGRCLYYMLSPEGDKHWCIAEFNNINPQHSYEVLDAFCDEAGNINTTFPRMKWVNSFTDNNGTTTVVNKIHFAKEEDLKQILEMGFEQGYTMGLNQLNDLIEQ